MIAVAVAALLSGCAVHGLALRQDTRLHIVEPADRSTVTLPLTLSWAIRDFAVASGRGSFAIVVDRAPPRPGETLGWLFRGSRECRAAGCLDPSFLAQRDVYETDRSVLAIDHVAHLSGRDRRAFHEVTIVLLDSQGRRIGESAWSRQFLVRPPSA